MTSRRVKKDLRWKLIKFTIFLCVFVGVFALVWLRTTLVNLEYELNELGNQKMELLKERRMVSAEKANFYSVEKIEQVAMEKLGMSLPKREKIIFVKRTTGAAPYRASNKSVPREY